MKIDDLDEFTQGYLSVALWSTTDEQGEPLDGRYDLEDIAPETVQQAFEDCQDFQQAQENLLRRIYIFYRNSYIGDDADAPSPETRAGHDFWLTSARHGAGFWDRGAGGLGDLLADAARVYRAPDLYVGDDGKIH